MKKKPNYDQRSEKIKEACENDVALKAARKEIFESLTQSVKIIKGLRTSDDENIKLKSCKEHLLLAGLYVEKHEYTGDPIQIFLPPADGGEHV